MSSTRTFDAKVYIDSEDNLSTTSTQDRGLFINSDTIRLAVSRTVTDSDDMGYPGEICWDENYIYVCVGLDQWKRSPLSSW